MIRYEGAMCGESEDGSRKGGGVGEGTGSCASGDNSQGKSGPLWKPVGSWRHF